MKKLVIILIISVSALAISFSFAQNGEKPLSEFLRKQKKEIEEIKKDNKTQMSEAKASANKERIVFLEDLDAALEASSRCYQEKEEIDIRVCMLNSYKKLAEKGNFIAQDMLAKYYLEFHQNTPLALKWYKKALENPRTAAPFKERITKDISTLEETLAKTESKNDASDLTQKEMDTLKKEKETITNQKRKAELLEDKENFVIYKEMEGFLDALAKCYEKKDDHEIYICSLEKIKKLAEEGNFVAQHQLGNIYENSYENKEMAIEWYQKGLANNKTPEAYHAELNRDLERAKEGITTEGIPTGQKQE